MSECERTDLRRSRDLELGEEGESNCASWLRNELVAIGNSRGGRINGKRFKLTHLAQAIQPIVKLWWLNGAWGPQYLKSLEALEERRLPIDAEAAKFNAFEFGDGIVKNRIRDKGSKWESLQKC